MRKLNLFVFQIFVETGNRRIKDLYLMLYNDITVFTKNFETIENAFFALFVLSYAEHSVSHDAAQIEISLRGK